MLSSDATWYVENMNQIATFEKWIGIVRSDLPKQISGLIGSAAEQAVDDLNNEPNVDGEYSAVHHEEGSWGFESYWALDDSWDEGKGVGAWIHAWLPRNINWLTSEGEDFPELSLCYYGGTKGNMTHIGDQISKGIRKLPSQLGVKVNQFEGKNFVCVKRLLNREINATALKDPKTLAAKLVPIFKEFTIAVRPGLEIVHTK
jgi:hypothetical protein